MSKQNPGCTHTITHNSSNGRLLVGRNTSHPIGSRQCKRTDRVIFIIILKMLHSARSLRSSRATAKEGDALSWAACATQAREAGSLTNIPVWTGLRLSLNFLSPVLTHSHVLAQIHQQKSLYYRASKYSSRSQYRAPHHFKHSNWTGWLQVTEHSWAFRKGLSDGVSQ